jgi:hypothetical protein
MKTFLTHPAKKSKQNLSGLTIWQRRTKRAEAVSFIRDSRVGKIACKSSAELT